MSTLTYNMKHFDQTTMFDSFMNIQDPLIENTNVDPIPNQSTTHVEWLQDDIDIFQLYNKARNNLSHVDRILNLTWRLHTVRARKSNHTVPSPPYQVENSFIFNQESSISVQPSPFHDYANSEYVPSQSGDPISSDNNTNMFIDNDNLISKDNEFDMFIDETVQINHSMVTPIPMDIPQSVPTKNMLPHGNTNNNSFSQEQMSSSFVFNYMTPSSFTPTTSFIPTPVMPLTSTTTTNIFNDSTILKNDNVSFSLPITNDMFKQKRSVAPAKKRSPSITKSRTNSTAGGSHSNNNNTPMKCSNCGTHNTPLWRKDPHGNSLCNACGLFLKLHGVMRPLSLKTDTIKKRQRNNNNNNNTNNSNTNSNNSSHNLNTPSRASTPNITKKNYIKKVGSKERINLDWLNLDL